MNKKVKLEKMIDDCFNDLKGRSYSTIGGPVLLTEELEKDLTECDDKWLPSKICYYPEPDGKAILYLYNEEYKIVGKYILINRVTKEIVKIWYSEPISAV